MSGLFSTKCFAQQYVKEQKLTRIVLVDGSEFIGTIAKEDESTVVFETTDGIVMSIPKEKVKSIGQLDFAGRRYRRVDPNQTRLFIAPTAKEFDPIEKISINSPQIIARFMLTSAFCF
jgi:hypothetical protein